MVQRLQIQMYKCVHVCECIHVCVCVYRCKAMDNWFKFEHYATIFGTLVYSVAYRNSCTIGESIIAHIGSFDFVYHIYKFNAYFGCVYNF